MASNPERSSGGGPLGIRLLMPKAGYNAHRAFVLILTFVAYSLYHVSRKPPSIVKSVLEADQEAAFLGWSNSSLGYFSGSRYFSRVRYYSGNRQLNASADGSHFLGWAPFEGSDGTARLGEIDVAFLAAYAVGMYFSGHLGDRLPLRWFLGVGMVGSSICVGLFGAGYWFNIHWMGYFVAVQMMGGLLQATGWPAVVAVVGNWFGKGRRGLIMGIWNAHTSVGNIIGSLVASSMLRYGWGWSFLVPAATLALGGVFVVLFLVVDPTEVGLPSPYESDDSDPSDPLDDYKPLPNSKDEELGLPNKTKSKALNKPIISKKLGKDVFREQPSFNHHQVQQQRRHHNPSQGSPVGFFRAWAIPGVAPFALCLFFSKLVAYTFLYWLPFYISQTEIDGKHLSDSTAGNLSTIFDIGGVIGGILAGHLSDKLNAQATVSATFMFLAVPVLLLYQAFGSISLWLNILLLAICGVLVNGPYALITTAVSADLGTHSSLKGNARALSTVTAIIDGTGSIGAALGPLITGLISSYGWDNVFYMLMGSAFISGLLLIRLVITELQEKVQRLGFSMSRLHHPLVA